MHQELQHNSVCPIPQQHNEKKCPLWGIEENIQDIGPIRFLWQELNEDPLRAARGIIYALLACGLIYLIVAMLFVAVKGG